MITGYWKLDREKSASQKEVMKIMGRKWYEIRIIDHVDEHFMLKLFDVPNKIPKLTMKAKLFVRLEVLKRFPKIPVKNMSYNHVLNANPKTLQHHPDDAKGFGDCESLSTWDEKTGTFTINWIMTRGVTKSGKKLTSVLRVDHRLRSDNELEAVMHIEWGDEEATCTKVYNRDESDAFIKQIETHQLKEFLK